MSRITHQSNSVPLEFCLLLLGGVCTSFPAETINCNNGFNDTIELKDETACIRLSPSKKDTIHIRQTSTHLHHRSNSKSQYDFYIPDLRLDCECTCNIYTVKSSCTSRTPELANLCDKEQFRTSTCTNLAFAGEKRGGCPDFYRVCCQAHFSIHDPNRMQTAYQLELLNIMATTFEITYQSGHGKEKRVGCRIPNWVENLIVGEGIMLAFEMRRNITSPYDLSDRWIYYDTGSGEFYTDVSINQKYQFDYSKLGWFHKNKQNNMDRIPRSTLENKLVMDLHVCKDDNTPNYSWKFEGAVNYYRDLNVLVSEKRGRSFSSVYEDKWFVDKKQFFEGRPAFVMTTIQLLPMKVKVTNQLPIVFSTKIDNSELLITIINQIPEGNYHVIGGYIEYRTLGLVTIDSNVQFPCNRTFAIPTGLKCNLTCIQKQDGNKFQVCVSSNADLPFQTDTEKRLDDSSHAGKEDIFQTATANDSSHAVKEDNTAIIVSVSCVAILIIAVICIGLYQRRRIANWCKKHRQPTEPANEPTKEPETFPLMNQGMNMNLSTSNDSSPLKDQGENTRPPTRNSSRNSVLPDTKTSTSYQFNHSPSGFCIIINNEEFKTKSPREGAQKDEDALKEVFENFDFKVQVEKDLTKIQMDQLLDELKTKDYGNYDCFVCCVLSRGDKEIVYTTDEQPVNIQEIVQQFNTQSLEKKPKIFIIDARQGKPIKQRDRTEAAATGAISRPIPHTAVLMATAPGYSLFTDKLNGSYFIQYLAQTLKQSGHELDFCQVVSIVTGLLDKSSSEDWNQMPVYMTSLKSLVFRRKQPTQALENGL